MSDYDESNEASMEAERNMKSVLLNSQGNELFDDEDYVIHKLITIRRVKLPNQGEDWEILENDVVVLTLKGTRLTKKEKSVLYTPIGLNIVMAEYKNGNKSVSGIKRKIREHLESL